MISGAGLPLNRLREAPGSVMTEFNPTYEFGGETYSIQDLKDIPRDRKSVV
jgi:anaplastic lymphoma kinase